MLSLLGKDREEVGAEQAGALDFALVLGQLVEIRNWRPTMLFNIVAVFFRKSIVANRSMNAYINREEKISQSKPKKAKSKNKQRKYKAKNNNTILQT